MYMFGSRGNVGTTLIRDRRRLDGSYVDEPSHIQHNEGKRQEAQQTLLEIGFRKKNRYHFSTRTLYLER